MSWKHNQPFDTVELNYRLNDSEPVFNKIQYFRNQTSGQFDSFSPSPNITERLYTSTAADNETFEISLRDVQQGEFFDATAVIGGVILGTDYSVIGYCKSTQNSFEIEVLTSSPLF